MHSKICEDGSWKMELPYTNKMFWHRGGLSRKMSMASQFYEIRCAFYDEGLNPNFDFIRRHMSKQGPYLQSL